LALATQTSEANQIRKTIKLNLEYFIAKRLITTKDYKVAFLANYKIAISAIAIGMIMMIVSVATGIGCNNSRKVSAFNGHIII
jgi:lipoprotein-releasing system permease protein